MAEWLTHVLVAYGVFTIVGWYVDWLEKRWVAVAMVGSILPDLNRFELFISSEAMSTLLGIPFDWGALHTIGGLVVLSAIGALLFSSSLEQKRGFVVLFGGGLSHLIVDVPQAYADGLAVTNLYLFPLTTWRAPTPGWYVSADRWVALFALVFALVVYIADRYRH